MVVLDTCALIALVQSKNSLSSKTLKLIENGSYLLSISFAEIACKTKIGKLDIGISTENLFFEINQIANINIVDISVQNWLASINLSWPQNKDPADRLVVAFAKELKIPVVTTDQRIKLFYDKVIW